MGLRLQGKPKQLSRHRRPKGSEGRHGINHDLGCGDLMWGNARQFGEALKSVVAVSVSKPMTAAHGCL